MACSNNTYTGIRSGNAPIDYNSPLGGDLQIELFPVHSPLLRKSLSFSFPGLTYMLKLSPYSCFTSCVIVNESQMKIVTRLITGSIFTRSKDSNSENMLEISMLMI